MYNRKYWQDHVTQYEDRFRETQNSDGTINHIPVEGEVLQEGTSQNAKNFNNLEEGVFSSNELVAELFRAMIQQGRTIKALSGEGPFPANEQTAELLRVTLQQGRALDALKGESGTVTLTNTQAYPFNNSAKSVPIAAVRDTTDYTVEVETGPNNPGVGRVTVYDKLKNGFKMAFAGGAATATVNYTVRGGLLL